MKKLLMILLAAIVLFASACGTNPAPIEMNGEAQESEAAPKKPTAAEAAKHNAAIDPGNIRLIQFEDPAPGDEIAIISTTEGDIKVRLFKAQAPETVNVFTRLAEEGYYNGSAFDEAVDGYKVDGAGKADDIVFPEEEYSLDLWNFCGAVAVSGNGSNFMIVTANHCLNPRTELEDVRFPEPVIEKYLSAGGAPHQDWKNTVFGQVVAGIEVAEKIAAVKEEEPATITEIKIETAA